MVSILQSFGFLISSTVDSVFEKINLESLHFFLLNHVLIEKIWSVLLEKCIVNEIEHF